MFKTIWRQLKKLYYKVSSESEWVRCHDNFLILTKNKFWDLLPWGHLIIVIIGSDQPHEQAYDWLHDQQHDRPHDQSYDLSHDYPAKKKNMKQRWLRKWAIKTKLPRNIRQCVVWREDPWCGGTLGSIVIFTAAVTPNSFSTLILFTFTFNVIIFTFTFLENRKHNC